MARKRRIEYAYELAQLNIERTRQELLSSSNFDDALASEFLPQLPTLDFASGLPLYPTADSPTAVFASRSDYERTLRYLDRINRAAMTEYTDRGNAPEGVTPTALTSFYINDNNGDAIQTEFMRHESRLFMARENQRRVKELRDRGIDMVRLPVHTFNAETGNYEVAHDETGHVIMAYAPRTPTDKNNLHYAAQKEKSLRPIQPDMPTGSVVMQWGEIHGFDTEHKYSPSPSTIARSMVQDYNRAMQTELYFTNMKELVDAVLDPSISDELDRYFEAILRESPERQYQIYRAMAGLDKRVTIDGKDPSEFIMTLGYLYGENQQSTGEKLYALFDVIDSVVSPMLSVDIKAGARLGNADEYEQLVSDTMPLLSEAQNILLRYQDMRKDGNAEPITMQQLLAIKSIRNRRK